MSGPLGELDPHDADVARWAFLNPETGDWIEVKPGTVVLAASERPVDPLREAAVEDMEREGVVTWGDPGHRERFLASPAAPRPEGLEDWPDRAWLISHWVGHRCEMVGCRATEPHEHGGGQPMREMTSEERAARLSDTGDTPKEPTDG